VTLLDILNGLILNLPALRFWVANKVLNKIKPKASNFFNSQLKKEDSVTLLDILNGLILNLPVDLSCK